MKKNPRYIGDQHVKSVHQGLLLCLENYPINHFPKSVTETVKYIIQLYPNIERVTSKFDNTNTNNSKDLTLYTNNNIININLFLLRKGSRIQPKNPGAKSFFLKYFLSKELQEMFNDSFEKLYIEYLVDLVSAKVGTHYITEKRELKKMVSKFFPRFTEEINTYRDKFLYSLREVCFTYLKDFYNNRIEGFFHAYNTFFMTDDVNIITSYGRDKDDVSVEEFNPGTPRFDDIHIYKIGQNTVGIKYGEVALTLRFKFESGPNSSIKLAASYDQLPNGSEQELKNNNTINQMLKLFSHHEYVETSNSSNAIGKCHEAITYYYFLKEYPDVLQVKTNECVELLNNYYSLVKPVVLEKLYKSTTTIIPAIKDRLNEKYKVYKLESIELVPDSYVTDKLDTGDLQLILKVNGDYIVENISLKALAKKGSKITTKNPGIGTILGPTYFNIGSMDNIVNEVKLKYQAGELTHRESLEIIASTLGLSLKKANQQKLKQGIENLLGKAMMAVTFYDDNVSYCKEYSKIESTISVFVNTPSAIQNTLEWNNGTELINLRVKFSRGQKYGWSTIKLASEYKLE